MLAEQSVEQGEGIGQGTAGIVPADIADEIAEVRTHMTSEYTSIWRVSDFLLDAAAKASDEKKAEIHLLHEEISPNSQRSVLKTSHARAIVEAVEATFS